MKTTNCKHESTTAGVERPYSGQVAVEPYTIPNRAAHGNISFVETCDVCRAQRKVNENGRHVEVGPWGMDSVGPAEYGHLMDYRTAEVIRPATEAEWAASVEAAKHDGGAGAIKVGERHCYVQD